MQNEALVVSLRCPIMPAYTLLGFGCQSAQCWWHSKVIDSGGIRTHASEETGALNQRLRPLGHAISWVLSWAIHMIRSSYVLFFPSPDPDMSLHVVNNQEKNMFLFILAH